MNDYNEINHIKKMNDYNEINHIPTWPKPYEKN